MIILGIVAAVWLGERRWAAKGGAPGVIVDVAVWAVPFGLVGGRLYHVVTDYQRYFGENGEPLRALEIWKGGLGIWGAIALGALGAYIGRRRGISILALADAVAPGIVLAQAIGRWGNYWNQELYGRPLDTFWALKIDENHRPMLDGGPALDPRYADIATYHPTFLYESLWCLGVAVLVIWADRRYKLTHGRAFALYVAAHGRTRLDRGAAHRRRPPHPRPAPQRLDVDRPVHRRGRLPVPGTGPHRPGERRRPRRRDRVR